jgi:xylulokinase
MSLQCFINGSFARENIKNKFNYNWENFSNSLLNTSPGNNNNLMIPFFTSEISPNNMTIKQPILQGIILFLIIFLIFIN